MVVGGGEALQQADLGHNVGDDRGSDQGADFGDEASVQRRAAGEVQGAVVVDGEGHEPHRDRHARGQQRHRALIRLLDRRRGDGGGLPGMREGGSDGGFVDDAGFEQEGVEGAAVDELLVDRGLNGLAVDVHADGAAEKRFGEG